MKLTRKRLERQLRDGTSLNVTATRLGFRSVTSLRIAAEALQVELPDERRRAVPAKARQEVRKAGVSSAHADAVLDPRHRGNGGYDDIPLWPALPGPALLGYLFSDLGLSKQEIGRRLHLGWEEMCQAFVDAGISSERHGHSRPFGRWRFDRDELRRLIDDGWSGVQIAEHLGISQALVLQALHRHHLPVSVAPNREETYVRFDELVADNRVVAALKKANVPLAEADPPSRGPLPPSLLEELIGKLDLGLFDVELLTGRTYSGVKRDIEKSGKTHLLNRGGRRMGSQLVRGRIGAVSGGNLTP